MLVIPLEDPPGAVGLGFGMKYSFAGMGIFVNVVSVGKWVCPPVTNGINRINGRPMTTPTDKTIPPSRIARHLPLHKGGLGVADAKKSVVGDDVLDIPYEQHKPNERAVDDRPQRGNPHILFYFFALRRTPVQMNGAQPFQNITSNKRKDYL